LLCIAIELADSFEVPNTVITFPSEPKDESRDPLACAGCAPTPTNKSVKKAKTPRKEFFIPLIYAINHGDTTINLQNPKSLTFCL